MDYKSLIVGRNKNELNVIFFKELALWSRDRVDGLQLERP